jgi:hypothetical protein
MKSKEEIAKKHGVLSGKDSEFDDAILKAMQEYANQCQEDMPDNSKLTRFEVIDENGRVYTKHNCTIELSYQDDSRTLKVFIKNKQD